MTTFTAKRIYDQPSESDGFRVLVDRIWPRGVAKSAAALSYWAKDIAPTTELRAWHRSHLDDEVEFNERYRAELEANPAFVEFRALVADERLVTLLYASRDGVANNATVLRDFLNDQP